MLTLICLPRSTFIPFGIDFLSSGIRLLPLHINQQVICLIILPLVGCFYAFFALRALEVAHHLRNILSYLLQILGLSGGFPNRFLIFWVGDFIGLGDATPDTEGDASSISIGEFVVPKPSFPPGDLDSAFPYMTSSLSLRMFCAFHNSVCINCRMRSSSYKIFVSPSLALLTPNFISFRLSWRWSFRLSSLNKDEGNSVM